MSYNTINWSALKGPERLASLRVVATAWTAVLPLKERSEIDRKGREGRREGERREEREEKREKEDQADRNVPILG